MCLALPGKIVEIISEENMDRKGKVDFDGVIQEVNLSFVTEAKVGDFVVVHVGFALDIVDPSEAKTIQKFLAEENSRKIDNK